MTMRLLCIAVVLLSCALSAAASDSSNHDEMVAGVLRDTPLIDGHNDAPWAIRSRFKNQLDAFDFHDTSTGERPMHTDIDRLRAGGVGAQFWSVWVPVDLDPGDAVLTTLEQIDLVQRLVARYPDDLELALTAADIRRIHAEGRIASLIGMEGGHSIANSLAVLRQSYAAGVRSMTLTHWDNVDWADAATATPEHDGLSPFGETVIAEMNRLGMMVDLSHVSAKTMGDVLRVSRAPVIFSHSSAFALNPHPRNVPDEILREVAKRGGVVMVNFGSYYLAASHTEHWANRKAEKARLDTLYPGDPHAVKTGMTAWDDAHPLPIIPLSVLSDHVDHIRQVAGIDHVGLGSDYDGINDLPEGMGDVTGYPALLEELAARGWSRNDLTKLAGENLLRVMTEVEQVAADLQQTEQPAETWFEAGQ